MTDIGILKQAFRYHALTALVVADGALFKAELALLDGQTAGMRAAGLMAENGTLTARYAEARSEALARLKTELGRDERLALVGEVLAAAVLDGYADDTEETTAAAVSAALGLSQAEVEAWVRARGSEGP